MTYSYMVIVYSFMPIALLFKFIKYHLVYYMTTE